MGIRVIEILIPERREREAGGGGWGKGVSNNEIICSSLPMGRTGGGACELFTPLLFRDLFTRAG